MNRDELFDDLASLFERYHKATDPRDKVEIKEWILKYLDDNKDVELKPDSHK